MSQWEKLIEKIRNRPAELQFREVAGILRRMGYSMHQPGSGSSHYTFRKKGKMPITIPRHNPIPDPYVNLIRKTIEDEEKSDERC